MPLAVANGAQTMCTFGMTPGTFTAIPSGTPILVDGKPLGKVTDNVPMLNIAPFNMCMTLTNPTVASATAAKLGVFTPMPCIPVITAPWVPGSPTVLNNNVPTLHQGCTCLCAWGGSISIMNPGQTKVMVP